MRIYFRLVLLILPCLITACSHNATQAPNMAGGIVGGGGQAADQSTGAQSFAAKVQTTFKTDQNGFKVNPMRAPSNQVYYFSFDRSAMRPDDVKALLIQANYLIKNPEVKIRLEGNTDNRGSREYNVALGWRRDQTVARLLEQQGVTPQQIDMVSFGKERPVAFGNDSVSWSLNRRVNLVYERMS